MPSALSDPLIDKYAAEAIGRIASLFNQVIRTLEQARRSVYSNDRISSGVKDEYMQRHRDFKTIVRRYVREHIYIPTKRGSPRSRGDLRKTINAFKSIEQDLLDRYRIILDERKQVMRVRTHVDQALVNLDGLLKDVVTRVDLIDKALTGDEPSIREIYQSVLAGNLAQEAAAPFLFEVIQYVINLKSSTLDITSRNQGVIKGVEYLSVSSRKLLDALEQSNADRRFVSAVKDYHEVISHNFNPILIDLLSNRLRGFLVELKNELSGFIIAETTALLLSQEQVLRQFPEWQQFSKAASEFHPDDEELRQQHSAISGVTEETKSAPNVAVPAVIDALEKLEEAGRERNTRSTTNLGVWRSFDNYVKANIGKIIEIVKLYSEKANAQQAEYLKYVERILPHIKLFVRMKESLHWLMPVIDWIEQMIKANKPH